MAAAIDAAEPDTATPPSPPRSSDSESFGSAGSVVLGEIIAARALTPSPYGVLGSPGPLTAGWFSFGSTRFGDNAVKTIAAEPSFDVFVANGVSLGALLGAGVTSYEANGSGNFSSEQWHATAMPRIGDTVALSKDIAVWPRFAAGVTLSDTPINEKLGVALRATFDVPFVFRVARHVALQAGPQLSYFNQLSGGPDVRGFSGGVSAGLSLLL